MVRRGGKGVVLEFLEGFAIEPVVAVIDRHRAARHLPFDRDPIRPRLECPEFEASRRFRPGGDPPHHTGHLDNPQRPIALKPSRPSPITWQIRPAETYPW